MENETYLVEAGLELGEDVGHFGTEGEEVGEESEAEINR